jgi:ribonucleoside-diphosphate reductase alpha chain
MKFLQNISEELFRMKYMINGESNPDQVFHDIAEEVSRVEKTEQKRDQARSDFEYIMNEGYFIPGGRILANARSYTHLKSRNYNNCFTIDIEDSIEGIYSAVYEDAMISRMGGGVGFDVSKLRPENSMTTNGGEASGPISFLRVFDASAKTISSGGSRRAAHIALMDIDHPDIEKFINVKQGDKEKKLSQFNISARITDAFMEAVKDDADWNLVFKGKIYKTLKARELFDAFAKNAYTHNDPGVFFIDRVERDNNAWWAFKMDRCNPCGEIPMPAYSLCDLGALNLTSFIIDPFEDTAHFDFPRLIKVIKIAIRFLDNVLDATQYPLEKIEEFSKRWRRVGLGFTGLADAIAMLQMKYGEEDSVAFCELFARTLRDESYRASVELAKEKGAAPGLVKKGFFKSIIDPRLKLGHFISNLPMDIREDIARYGLRNIGLNTVAPTGTTSLTVGNNCSSGIEPVFEYKFTRNIRTGKGDETKPEVVRDYACLVWEQLHPGEPLPNYFITTLELDPYKGIDIQAAIQKYLDHSISKTANLPKGYTFEQYKGLFGYAYNKGLKGFTTFNPEGSMKGVLESKPSVEDKPETFIVRSDAPKRPNELQCDIHYVHANNQDFIVLAGMLNGSLYEIFVDEQNGHDLGSIKTGKIIKKSKGEYALISPDGTTLVDGLSKNFDGTWGSLARMISMSLRHGVPLQFVIDQLQRSKEFLGFEKAVSRVLKHYLKEGESFELKEKCSKCGGKLTLQEGCYVCKSCGNSACS